ncbi:MAG: hypothetical protein ACFBRM_14190 [Pikeienuella sp.]
MTAPAMLAPGMMGGDDTACALGPDQNDDKALDRGSRSESAWNVDPLSGGIGVQNWFWLNLGATDGADRYPYHKMLRWGAAHAWNSED